MTLYIISAEKMFFIVIVIVHYNGSLVIFGIIAISETRITKQVSLLNNLNLNNYSFEFTATETSAGGTFFTLLIIYHINALMT